MRTKLRRATSGVLSVAMIASALFSDFSVPTSVYASDDTSSVETALDGYSDSNGSITSEYIVENLDEDLGEEAAALNEDAAYMVAEEYLVSELTDAAEEVDTVEVSVESEADDLIGTSSNDVSTSSNDADVLTLSPEDETSAEETDETETEVVVLEEEVAEIVTEILDTSNDITAADDYDTNGLAPTYHYITLNYSLIDSDYVWDGMTIDDVWNEVPDAFIASYLTYVNVYTLEDNEDYYVAFIDPASLNGLGSAIYADFTDLDTYNPTVYNDIITFDAETGLVYIPKSFYFNEEGVETLKELEAQVLVPYSFDNDTSVVSVSVSSDMDGVEGISGSYSVPTLDVTMTLQIVDAEDADKISLDDIVVSVNDDMYAYDLSDGNGYYDTETGELTISASPNSVYSVNVTISEGVAEETLASAEQREILVATTGDLSGILVAETELTTDITYASSAEDMKTVPGVTVSVDEGTLAKGQTFVYSAVWASNISSMASTVNEVISKTAIYSYYGFNGTNTIAVNDNDIFDSNGNFVSAGDVAYIARNGDNSTWEYNPYNRMVQLPDGMQLVSTSDSSVKTSWDVSTITGADGSYVSGYENYIAISCVHNTQSAGTTDVQSGTDDFNIKVLYVKQPTNTDVGYMVFSITLPSAGGQAGSGVFKVELTSTTTTSKYYARFGVKKTSSATGATLSGAVFAYEIRDASHGASMSTLAEFTADVGTKYSTGELTDVQLENALKAVSMDGIYACSSSSTPSSVAISTNNGLFPSTYYDDEGYIYVYLTEVKAPTGYVRNTGVWRLKVSVSEDRYSDSKILSAEYFDYDVDSGTLSSTSTSVSYTSGSFYIVVPNDTYYAAMDIIKTDADSGEPVANAVYALIDVEEGTSTYSNYVTWAATAASKSSKEEAILSFYKSLGSYSDAMVGVYRSHSDGTQSALKSFSTTTGTIDEDDSITLELGADKTKKYLIIEIWSPDEYVLDTNYYTFTLNSNGNTSSNRSVALRMTTISNFTPSSTSGNSVSISGNTSSSNTSIDTNKLYLEFNDVHLLYSKLGIVKVNSESTSTKVSGAVYVISDDLNTVNAAYILAATYSDASEFVSDVNSMYDSNTLQAVETSSSGAVYFPVALSWNPEEDGTTKTFYVKEVINADNYNLETGYYVVKVKGTTDSDGVASTITSITPTNISGSSYYKIVSGSNGEYAELANTPSNYYGRAQHQ